MQAISSSVSGLSSLAVAQAKIDANMEDEEDSPGNPSNPSNPSSSNSSGGNAYGDHQSGGGGGNQNPGGGGKVIGSQG